MLGRSTHAVGGLRSRVVFRSIVINPEGALPYGLSNWNMIRKRQRMYVDRTKAIAELDAKTGHSCLWSPRRTGKSLMANQLALWHDKSISEKERTELFSGTYIGQNPSVGAGRYLVLALDFSDVDERDVERSFTKVVNASVQDFSEQYYESGFLKRPVKIDNADFASSLSDLASTAQRSGHKVSLIVDEVDSFANRLLLQVSHEKGLDSFGYHEFVKKEGSVLRRFGRTVKKHSSTCIERMFFTGVMPVACSDAFSSLNTVDDLTNAPTFYDALGFKTSDIEELLGLLFPAMDPEERAKHLSLIRSKCNVYRRSSSQVEGLYNTQGVWYYLKELQRHGDSMVPCMDPNIVQPVRDEVAAFLVKHAAAATTYSPLHFFIGTIPFIPAKKFSAELLFDPDRAPQALLSMAHYSGYLSFQYPKDEVRGDVLVAPNDDMREIFMDAVLDGLPGHYKSKAEEWIQQGMSPAVAVIEAYESYVKATQP